MAKQIGDLTALTVLSDADLVLVRDSAVGVDTKMLGSDLVSEVNREVRLENTNVTILDTFRNPVILMTTGAVNRTVTLPTLADNQGMIVTVVKDDSGIGSTILDGEGAETINGVLTISLISQYTKITIIAGANEWLILQHEQRRDISSVSADHTILDIGPDIVLMTSGASDRTITLPTAANNNGRIIRCVKVDSGVGNMILDGEGAETIGGQTIRTIQHQNGVMIVVCDGTNWEILEGEFQRAVFDIGDWNMDSAASVTVSLGIAVEQIRSAQVIIRADDAILHYHVPRGMPATQNEVDINVLTTSGDTINIQRLTAGGFDSTFFNATSFNRGWVSIQYAT